MDAPKSNLTRHWQALDAAHHVHPFSNTAALNRVGVRVITRGEGVYLLGFRGPEAHRRHVGAVVRAGRLRQ